MSGGERGVIAGLYAIAPACADTGRLLAMVDAALRGGARLVQYRDKSGDVALRHEQASELLPLCRRFGVPLIVNDDLRLADLVGADGVHLGQTDGTVREARIVLGPARIVGRTCHASLELALEAQREGADYVAFGGFFASPSKPDAARADLALLRETRARLTLPIVAIGGIARGNAGALIDAGADALAVISDLFDAADIEAAAREFAGLFSRKIH
jgi:thiamine-phosphate pyrophosphorylase